MQILVEVIVCLKAIVEISCANRWLSISIQFIYCLPQYTRADSEEDNAKLFIALRCFSQVFCLRINLSGGTDRS